ncbi:hypothetical protein NQD34_002686 [Periophthalmus magnuspinnatus]|nr:hypothetical protein NQD34_002686 [Periophthalmus magnuspinnatus]
MGMGLAAACHAALCSRAEQSAVYLEGILRLIAVDGEKDAKMKSRKVLLHLTKILQLVALYKKKKKKRSWVHPILQLILFNVKTLNKYIFLMLNQSLIHLVISLHTFI